MQNPITVPELVNIVSAAERFARRCGQTFVVNWDKVRALGLSEYGIRKAKRILAGPYANRETTHGEW